VLRRAIFDCCKWHTQVEDRPVVCPFPLVLDEATWAHLAGLAAALATETLAAECEVLDRCDLHAHLGLTVKLCRGLRRVVQGGLTPGGVRVMRFDFHWTTEAWRISEGNTDVAGGFIEASGVTRLMAEHYRDCRPAGDPAGDLCAAIRRLVGPKAMVGLMHLTVYSEDRQVMLYLARRLEECGLSQCLFSPEQLRWTGGQAGADCAWHAGPVDLLIRFFPAEWLPRLPARTQWERFLIGGRTAVCNPAHAVMTQSKRFPLIWDKIATRLPTWRSLLPDTRSPREVDGGGDWVLKPALGHEGHDVAICGVNEPADWQRIHAAAARNPDAWVAQRRFEGGKHSASLQALGEQTQPVTIEPQQLHQIAPATTKRKEVARERILCERRLHQCR